MIKQKFLINSNSFCRNGGIFHAVSGVKDGSCGELGTNLLQRPIGKSSFLSIRKPHRTTEHEQRDRHRRKRRSIVCTLELLSSDASL